MLPSQELWMRTTLGFQLLSSKTSRWLAEALMALRNTRSSWFPKNPSALGDLASGMTDTEVTVRPGHAPESKKKESPYYARNQSGTFSPSIRPALGVVNGGQLPSSNQNGSEPIHTTSKPKVKFTINGDAPHRDLPFGNANTDPKVKRTTTGSKGFDGMSNGDDSPESTFEIPLDKINSRTIGKEKPKNDESLSRSRPESLPRSGSERSRQTLSKPNESSVLKSSLKGSSTFSSVNGSLLEKSDSRRYSNPEIARPRPSTSTNKNQDPLYRKSANAAAAKLARIGGVSVMGVASASYSGGWLPPDGMVPYPKDIIKFNKFLKNCRSEVEAGVPGRWLTVVMGNETADLDSIVSTLAYAFFLGSTGSEDQQFFVPVLNMRREDFALHTEAVWLFECTGVDVESFIFVDQISLSYFHRFGSLRLILVDHSRLAPHQENLQEAVVEIVDHNVPENLYPWVSTLEIEQVGSCATIIAERYAAEAPQLAAGRRVSRLLLAAILLDTNNLEPNYSRCTSRDECMAAFLLHGAGRYGRHGFYKLLRKKKYDLSGLTTKDTMRKDFKQWTLGPGKTDVYGCKGQNVAAGMSTLGMALYDFLRRDPHILKDIQLFRRSKKLDVLIIITGYYDNANHYKREFLVAPEDEELTRHLTTCFKAHSEELKLSTLHIDGLPKDMLAYIQGNVTASRKTLRSILAEFFAT